MGQYLAKHVRQRSREWSDIGHQDAPTCHLAVWIGRTSEVQIVEMGNENWIPDHVEPSDVQTLKNPNPLKDVEALAVLVVAVLV